MFSPLSKQVADFHRPNSESNGFTIHIRHGPSKFEGGYRNDGTRTHTLKALTVELRSVIVPVLFPAVTRMPFYSTFIGVISQPKSKVNILALAGTVRLELTLVHIANFLPTEIRSRMAH